MVGGGDSGRNAWGGGALACWLTARPRGEAVGWLGWGGPHRTLNDLHSLSCQIVRWHACRELEYEHGMNSTVSGRTPLVGGGAAGAYGITAGWFWVFPEVDGITKDLPRGRRKPSARSTVESRIIELTTQERLDHATRWTTAR